MISLLKVGYMFVIYFLRFSLSSDLNCLTSTAPPAATEWQSLLRPLRGREPEGIWNLLSIVRELFRRQDSNAVPLLEILTDEMLQCEQVSIFSLTLRLSVSRVFLTLSCVLFLVVDHSLSNISCNVFIASAVVD